MQAPCIARRHRIALRRGMTATELIVAATLLASAFGIMAPLAVKVDRIWHDARDYRLAVDELSNQLDRLRSLEAKDREQALTRLAASEELREVLSGAKLDGQIVRDDDGTRLVLRIDWPRPGSALPLELVGWLDAVPAESVSSPAEQPSEQQQEQPSDEAEQ